MCFQWLFLYFKNCLIVSNSPNLTLGTVCSGTSRMLPTLGPPRPSEFEKDTRSGEQAQEANILERIPPSRAARKRATGQRKRTLSTLTARSKTREARSKEPGARHNKQKRRNGEEGLNITKQIFGGSNVCIPGRGCRSPY